MLKRISYIGLLGLAIAGCQNNSQRAPISRADVEKYKDESVPHATERFYLGQVQIRTTDEDSIDSVISRMSAKNGITLSLLDKIPNQPIYLLKVEGTQPLGDVISSLKSDADVIAAGRSYEVRSEDFKTNDPLLQTQWALQNDAQEAPGALAGLKGAHISMGGVTAEGSKEVVVGIIDTGVDYLHEDLAVVEKRDGVDVVMPESNIWINPKEIPGNKINDDNNGDPRVGWGFTDDVYGFNFVNRTGDPMDDMGHGTHVAGVIGALRNNHKGIAGINGHVSMMGLKFLDADGSGSDFDAQMALYYMMDMKKRFPEKRFLSSNSWGSSSRTVKNGDEDDVLLMAFADAEREGILNIAAAGNAGTSNRFFESYPANYADRLTNMLTVAATNNMDQLASFSSYGFGRVQVAAPGVLIMSTVPAKLYGTGYQAWSGTSMATPQVSGLAALVWAANMQMTALEVKERIMNTVDILPQLHGSVTTSGRINVKRALANEINVSTMPVAEIVPYVFESPRGNSDGGLDWLTTIKQEGAKELAVCFSRIDLASNFDWLDVLDSGYRVRDTISDSYKNRNYRNESREVCSAPVRGDTLHLRLWSYMGLEGMQGFQTAYLKVVK